MIKIIVADRGKADVYESAKAGERLVKVKSLLNEAAHKHESELASDAPGRAFNRSAGIHQSYGERHKLRDDATKAFVREVVGAVEADILSPACAGFILIGSPRLLSQYKGAMSKLLMTKLLGKISKDLSRQPPREIIGHLAAWRRERNARIDAIEDRSQA